jgi:trigger factor
MSTVEVPKTFYNEQFRGKKVEIEINVKDVKALTPAVMDEDFFKKFGVDDEGDLKDRIRESHEEQADRASRQQMADQIYQYLLKEVDFDMPESIVVDQAQRIVQRQYSNLLMKGLDKDKVEEEMKILQASSEDQAKEQMKLFFVMDKIAEKLKVEVTPEEINGHIAQIAAQRGKRPEKMREELARDGSLAQFTLQVREQKCVEKMLESAKVTEVAGDKKPAAKKKTAKKKTAAKKTVKKDDAEKKTVTKKKTTKKKTTKKEE